VLDEVVALVVVAKTILLRLIEEVISTAIEVDGKTVAMVQSKQSLLYQTFVADESAMKLLVVKLYPLTKIQRLATVDAVLKAKARQFAPRLKQFL
jgi:hypothetical protein